MQRYPCHAVYVDSRHRVVRTLSQKAMDVVEPRRHVASGSASEQSPWNQRYIEIYALQGAFLRET